MKRHVLLLATETSPEFKTDIAETFSSLDNGSTRLSRIKLPADIEELIATIIAKEGDAELNASLFIEEELKISVGKIIKRSLASKAV